MAGIFCGVGGETETSAPVEPSWRSARRRRMEVHQFNFVPADGAVRPLEPVRKRLKAEKVISPPRLECEDAVHRCEIRENQRVESRRSDTKSRNRSVSPTLSVVPEGPKFGMTSVCGRRRDMEDAVAVHPSFCRPSSLVSGDLHFFGVYDGHGCSHVAMKCKDRMHLLVKDELEKPEVRWEEAMAKSFSNMDAEVTEWSNIVGDSTSSCRCELRTPKCEAVGSTAVVAVVAPDKILISNCGDSRAVLCRNGVAIPLSNDHKPDRPDELNRIEEAGGRVIYWDGARVLGMLAMSRAIGDNYLKPFVISEPEVNVIDRAAEDECLILASDGLWDVVSNETACGVARMCLRSVKPPSPPRSPGNTVGPSAAGEGSDKACSDASILLTKLALARNSTDNVSVIVVDLRKDP